MMPTPCPATKTTAYCVFQHAPVPRHSPVLTQRSVEKAKNATQILPSPRLCTPARRKYIPTPTRIISIRWRPIQTGRPLSAAMICEWTGGTWTATTRASVSPCCEYKCLFLCAWLHRRSNRHRFKFLSPPVGFSSARTSLTLSSLFIPISSFRCGGY